MDRSDHFRIVRKFEFERLEIFAKLRTCWNGFLSQIYFVNDNATVKMTFTATICLLISMTDKNGRPGNWNPEQET
ncbi:hypothetical protein T4D_6255 [Trichinella pseudospiralis]|uniref:Uncharacterized protein n=1 Tax=Trichinella pseudospiralis TaxID=6337 RepID=A0A0V1FW73_TRIPS|nr:hypothetical protein T4D_6255 [Trichinella pseudospiralis]